MRLIRVHDEPKLGPNVGPGGELAVVPHYLLRRPLAALDLHALGTHGIVYEGCTASQRPPKAWAPAPLMLVG